MFKGLLKVRFRVEFKFMLKIMFGFLLRQMFKVGFGFGSGFCLRFYLG
jgi:hypothetical protein